MGAPSINGWFISGKSINGWLGVALWLRKPPMAHGLGPSRNGHCVKLAFQRFPGLFFIDHLLTIGPYPMIFRGTLLKKVTPKKDRTVNSYSNIWYNEIIIYNYIILYQLCIFCFARDRHHWITSIRTAAQCFWPSPGSTFSRCIWHIWDPVSMSQPAAQKQPSWWQRIFTTAPRGQYAVDEKQQVVKENEFPGLRWVCLKMVSTPKPNG